MMRRYLSVVMVVFWLAPSFTSAQTVDWSTSFLFRTTGGFGFENPMIRVAFDPRDYPPDPVMPTLVDLSEPRMLTLTIPDIGVTEGKARILFAVEEDYTIVSEGTPEEGVFEFETFKQGVQKIRMTMSTGSGGIPNPGEYVGFNPQPEPPANFLGMGYDLQFSSFSPATLVIEIFDDGVEEMPFSFQLIQAADFNADGAVDQGDLKTWQENFSSTDAGDANLNGLTDGDDFLRWQRQYTQAEGIATIPEPGCLAILLSGLTALLFIRKRKDERCDSPGTKSLERSC